MATMQYTDRRRSSRVPAVIGATAIAAAAALTIAVSTGTDDAAVVGAKPVGPGPRIAAPPWPGAKAPVAPTKAAPPWPGAKAPVAPPAERYDGGPDEGTRGPTAMP